MAKDVYVRPAPKLESKNLGAGAQREFSEQWRAYMTAKALREDEGKLGKRKGGSVIDEATGGLGK